MILYLLVKTFRLIDRLTPQPPAGWVEEFLSPIINRGLDTNFEIFAHKDNWRSSASNPAMAGLVEQIFSWLKRSDTENQKIHLLIQHPGTSI
jgi:hypothetical protein